MAGPTSLIMSLTILLSTTLRIVEGLAFICRIISPMYTRDKILPAIRWTVIPQPVMHTSGFETERAAYLIGRCAGAFHNNRVNSLVKSTGLRSFGKMKR